MDGRALVSELRNAIIASLQVIANPVQEDGLTIEARTDL